MFVEKLNKKLEGVYVIEEEKTIVSGKWEGYLDHDNANHETIYIYTGEKLTGEKVENYFISTPSEMPWKTHIKAFSKSEKIYITYETTGDQVEAEDINLVQDEMVNEINRAIAEETRIDTKLNNEIVRAIAEDEILGEDVEELKEKKADKVYVDTELNKVYKKEEVFTKEEVLQKIEEIIDAAPDALDTLGKLAEALDNDPNFATNIINLLSTKVDKIEGKGLSDENYTTTEKNKLAGIEEGANKYIHPATHSADMIVENSGKRFTSDVEKAEWNDANSKKHTHGNKSILDTITQSLIDAWNSAVEHISDGIRHITGAERIRWNSKAEGVHKHKTDDITGFPTEMTPEYTAIPSNADLNDYTEIGFYGTANSSVGNTVTNKPSGASSFSLIVSKRGSYTAQILIDWVLANPYMWIRSYSSSWGDWRKVPFEGDIPTKVGQLENDKNYVTSEKMSSAGFGDMLKSMYDKNNNGKVDIAELADSVPWSGVTNKPSTFPPSSHNHDTLYEPKNPNIQSHISNKSNPHGTTKSDVGLGSVLNYGIATQTIAEIGTSNSYYMTPLRVKQSIEKNAMSKGPLTWNELKGV